MNKRNMIKTEKLNLNKLVDDYISSFEDYNSEKNMYNTEFVFEYVKSLKNLDDKNKIRMISLIEEKIQLSNLIETYEQSNILYKSKKLLERHLF